jgi:hypothetical protein
VSGGVGAARPTAHNPSGIAIVLRTQVCVVSPRAVGAHHTLNVLTRERKAILFVSSILCSVFSLMSTLRLTERQNRNVQIEQFSAITAASF